MKVKLIDYQPNALELLIYTKNTRLRGNETLESIEAWPIYKKAEHLDYMLKTIQSSWEFVYYMFEIENVSRVFTHQLVRTRTASFAQESQRTVKAESYINPCDNHMASESMNSAFDIYNELLEAEEQVQDARYVLPMGTSTSIIFSANLRTLAHMAELRLCTRTAGEYQEVFKSMREEICKVHPWARNFLEVYCVRHGICAFPNYKDCPIQDYTIDITADIKDKIREKWERTRHIANPVAKDGKTM